MKKRKKSASPTLIWQEEHQLLTLEGEPVLEYTLHWPQVQGAGWGGRWVNCYYAHLAKSWRERWQREIYWKACLSLVERRSQSRPFQPWRGELRGKVTLWEKGLLSLRLWGEEERGDGRPCQVCWGDVWRVAEGRACPPRDFFPGKGRWKRDATDQILRQGRQAKQAGAVFLDDDWEERLPRYLALPDFSLTQESIDLTLPACAISPAVEGPLHFSIPRGGQPCP